MTGEHDGSGGTSGRDGAEPTGPRTVPLDDLFGVTPSVTDDEAPPPVRTTDPTRGEPVGTGAEPPSVPGWDTSPHRVSFATLSGAAGAPSTAAAADRPAGTPTDESTGPGTDEAAAPAPVRRLTLDGPGPDPVQDGTADDGGAGTARPRVVSFDELSGRGAARGGPRGTPHGGARRDRVTPRRRPATDADTATHSGTATGRATDRVVETAAGGPADTLSGGPGGTGRGPGGPGGTPRGRRRDGGRGGGRRRGEDATPRDETPQEQETRARDICLRLLTDRARTVKELGDALRRKEIPDEVARRVLDRFDEVGLVDDEAFAEQWVRSRHRHRGLGKRAIALELHRKGVDREIADEALTGIDDDSERDRARELVVRRLRSLPVGSREERQSSARKLVGMLARKGYGPGVAYGVVKEEIAAAGAEVDELGEAPPED
ncbi:regulatory protein RecX [Pseudonocardia sp. ICBG1293]|uniref:regulatory protein RecX n=1 Tax=Pseudonocardia sp. ICBG1293 TaxID=2844382 RepID=UPI0027DF3D58|nr:regulatory protein RecX [Pseudonocardia sp. ICBG1293]